MSHENSPYTPESATVEQQRTTNKPALQVERANEAKGVLLHKAQYQERMVDSQENNE